MPPDDPQVEIPFSLKACRFGTVKALLYAALVIGLSAALFDFA
jgi:hypothetical protein